MDYISDFEVDFLFFLQDYVRMPILTEIMKFFSLIGDSGIIAIIACLVLLAIKKTRRIGITATMSLLINVLLVNVLIKPLVARVRPYEAFNNLSILVHRESDYSFPSGHSAICFSVAMVIFMLMPKKYGIPALIIAFLIAFSRLYVGVHYPSDVIVGIIIGTFAAILARLIAVKILKFDFS